MRRAALAVCLLITSCKAKPPRPASADLSVPAVARHLRSDVKDSRGWAADVRLALRHARQPVTPTTVCQVLAVVEQESGYAKDPAVPGLGKVVKGELDDLFAKLGPAAGPVRKALLDHVGSGHSTTFEARLSTVKTEQEADQLYREIVDFHRAAHPTLSRAMDLVAPDLVERKNPITTAGSMQVSVRWAIEHGEREGLGGEDVRDLLYTRAGGLKYGTAGSLPMRPTTSGLCTASPTTTPGSMLREMPRSKSSSLSSPDAPCRSTATCCSTTPTATPDGATPTPWVPCWRSGPPTPLSCPSAWCAAMQRKKRPRPSTTPPRSRLCALPWRSAPASPRPMRGCPTWRS